MPYLHRSLQSSQRSRSTTLNQPDFDRIDNSIGAPNFHCAQRVQFLGGAGIVRSYKPEADSWSYLIEMELDPEPEFGRIGAEAMVIITEADLDAA
ncbi:MAG: hypothetical protein RLZZ135_1178 [Cyanobacteriota bacterium]